MLQSKDFTPADASNPRSHDYLLTCLATSEHLPANRLRHDAIVLAALNQVDEEAERAEWDRKNTADRFE